MKKITYSLQINQYLAHEGYDALRDEHTSIKRVCFIGGNRAVLGEIVKKRDLAKVKQSGKLGVLPVTLGLTNKGRCRKQHKK